VRHPWGTRASSARLLTVLAIVAGFAAAISACGVPDSSDFEPIRSEDIPFGLDDTTTTASTTTVPDTNPSSNTQAHDGVTSVETTTTVVDTEPVELYFVTESSFDPRLTSVTRALSRPAGLSQVIAALEEGPPDDTGTGLKTLVPDGLVTAVREEFGVAVVEFDDEVFSEVPDSEQDPLIAQLVLTMGSRPGVGQVQFLKDGENLFVRVPSRGNALSALPVAADDFVSLLSDATNPPPTSSEPSAPTTETPPPTSGEATSTTTRPPRRTTTTTTPPRSPRPPRTTTTTSG
jgi:spore germination protein GerM